MWYIYGNGGDWFLQQNFSLIFIHMYMVKNKSKIIYIRWMTNGFEFEIRHGIKLSIFTYIHYYLLIHFCGGLYCYFGVGLVRPFWNFEKAVTCVFLCISEITLHDFRRALSRGRVTTWYLHVVYIPGYIWGFWLLGALHVIYVNPVSLINTWDVFPRALHVRPWVW